MTFSRMVYCCGRSAFCVAHSPKPADTLRANDWIPVYQGTTLLGSPIPPNPAVRSSPLRNSQPSPALMAKVSFGVPLTLPNQDCPSAFGWVMFTSYSFGTVLQPSGP